MPLSLRHQRCGAFGACSPSHADTGLCSVAAVVRPAGFLLLEAGKISPTV